MGGPLAGRGVLSSKGEKGVNPHGPPISNNGCSLKLSSFQVLNKMREIIGFNDGDSILAPGGSISNMYALLIARHKGNK
jgi:hypothetical protein